MGPRLAWLLLFGLLVTGCSAPTEERGAEASDSHSTAAAAPSPGTTAFVPAPADGNLTVAFVDVGQGAAVVQQFPDSLVVFDAANLPTASTGALLTYLAGLGTTRVDHLIISNPDADHSAACNEIFRDYTVGALYHPGNPKDTNTWNDCLDAAANETGLAVHTDADLNPGDLLPLSSHAAVRVLNIDAASSTINAGSLALRIDFGNVSWIFSGDIDCPTEDKVRARGFDLDVDLLQVGHHGSKSSSCTPWLQALSPAAAFISVGSNSYGHPTPEVLQRLADAGATVYRTDLHGTITITTDGNVWAIATATREPTEPTSSTSAETSSATPTPQASRPLAVAATAVPAQPCRYGTVEIHVTVTGGDGAGVESASVTSTWRYKTTTSYESGTTDSGGQAVLERSIGGASAGYTVGVTVAASKDGASGTAHTSFTPRDC